MYKTRDFRGTLQNPIRVRGISSEETLFRFLADNLPTQLKNNGVPAITREDRVKSGGLFGSESPMLIISHPNPPTRFFDIALVVNQNAISFQFLGESVQNTKANKLEQLRAEGKLVRSWMVKPDEIILQQEALWNREVVDAVDGLFE